MKRNKPQTYDFYDWHHYIPKAARDAHNSHALAALLAQELSRQQWDFSESMSFVDSVLKHQSWREDSDEEYVVRMFPAEKITDVRFFDRHTRETDKFYGMKARIYFDGRSFNSKKKDAIEAQSIDTDFLSLNWHNLNDMLHPTILAKTLAVEAMRSLGAPAVIEKVTKNKNEGRWAINVTRGYSDSAPYPDHIVDPFIIQAGGKVSFLNKREKDDIVASVIHGKGVEDGLQSLCETMDLPDSFADDVLDESSHSKHNPSRDNDFDTTTGFSMSVLMELLLEELQ